MGTTPHPESRRGRARGGLIVALCLSTIAAAVAVAVIGLSPDDDSGPPGDGEPTVIASAAGASVTAATLTTAVDPATGTPTDSVSTVAVGAPITAVIEFTYTGAAEGQDSLFVVWLRDDEELQRNAFRLPQPGPSVNATLGAQQTDQVGEFRAEVRVGNTVESTLVLSLEFEVDGA